MKSASTVGAVEAKTKFSELLERVSQGAEITITKHERPVARLVPVDKPSRKDWVDMLAEMAAFRAKHPLNPKGLKIGMGPKASSPGSDS